MGALLIEPKNGRPVCGFGTLDGQVNPVLDRRIFDLAHAPNVSFFYVVSKDDLMRLVINLNNTRLTNFKGFIM